MPHAPIFLPTVGKGEELKVHNTLEALELISKEIAQDKPETIVIISPHGPRFSDALSIYNQKKYRGDLMLFGDYDHTFEYEKDQAFIEALVQLSIEGQGLFYPLDDKLLKEFDYPRELDHGVLVPMYFVGKAYREFKLVCLSSGDFSSDDLIKAGNIIRLTAEKLNRNICIIASGDLSHSLSDQGPYRYHDSGPYVDGQIIKALKDNHWEDLVTIPQETLEESNVCGLESLLILLGAYENYNYQSSVLSYEGPFGVGYGVARFEEDGPTHICRSDLAKKIIRKRILEKRSEMSDLALYGLKVLEARLKDPLPIRIRLSENGYYIGEDFTKASQETLRRLQKPVKNIFASIKKDGSLRGCIGSISSEDEEALYQRIAYFVWQAAQNDPRFEPVTLEEFDRLTVSIDLISDYEQVSNASELDPKTYGVLVTNGHESGLLLPDLSGVDTSVEQLRIASQKAGFSVEEILKIYRFTVERFS